MKTPLLGSWLHREGRNSPMKNLSRIEGIIHLWWLKRSVPWKHIKRLKSVITAIYTTSSNYGRKTRWDSARIWVSRRPRPDQRNSSSSRPCRTRNCREGSKTSHMHTSHNSRPFWKTRIIAFHHSNRNNIRRSFPIQNRQQSVQLIQQLRSNRRNRLNSFWAPKKNNIPLSADLPWC